MLVLTAQCGRSLIHWNIAIFLWLLPMTNIEISCCTIWSLIVLFTLFMCLTITSKSRRIYWSFWRLLWLWCSSISLRVRREEILGFLLTVLNYILVLLLLECHQLADLLLKLLDHSLLGRNLFRLFPEHLISCFSGHLVQPSFAILTFLSFLWFRRRCQLFIRCDIVLFNYIIHRVLIFLRTAPGLSFLWSFGRSMLYKGTFLWGTDLKSRLGLLETVAILVMERSVLRLLLMGAILVSTKKTTRPGVFYFVIVHFSCATFLLCCQCSVVQGLLRKGWSFSRMASMSGHTTLYGCLRDTSFFFTIDYYWLFVYCKLMTTATRWHIIFIFFE